MNINKVKKTEMSLTLFPIFIAIFFISAFTPYIIDGAYYNEIGAVVYFPLAWFGLSFIISSYISIFYARRALSILFQFIGIFWITIQTIGYLSFRPNYFSLGIGFFLSLISWIGFWILVYLLISDEDLINKDKERKILNYERQKKFAKRQTLRLIGMIKTEKKLNLKKGAQILEMTEKEVQLLIYELVGEGKLAGYFQEMDFIITSDIDTLIMNLDNAFSLWEYKSELRQDKI